MGKRKHVQVKSVCLLSTMEPFNTPPAPQIWHWRISPRLFGQDIQVNQSSVFSTIYMDPSATDNPYCELL